MATLAWITASLALASVPAEQSVQQTVSRNNRTLRRCFTIAGLSSGYARLRFRVGRGGRAERVRVEAARGFDDHESVRACLVRTIEMLVFEPSAAGADVAYPVRFDGDDDGPERASGHRTQPELRLSIARIEPRLLGDEWAVVDHRGQGVSDVDLARLAGHAELATQLEHRRSRLLTYVLIEGAVAAAAFGTAGYGGYRLSQAESAEPLGLGLVAGGGALCAAAGSLFLYHLVRALDVSSVRPTWHAVDRPVANQLVATANRGLTASAQ